MKIILLVLKLNETWKFDISCCHSLFEDVFKVSTSAFTQAGSLLIKLSIYGLVDGVLWKIIPYCSQDFLQLVNRIWLGMKLIKVEMSCSVQA